MVHARRRKLRTLGLAAGATMIARMPFVLVLLLLAACQSYRPVHVEAPDLSREAPPTLITEVDVFSGFDDFLVRNVDVLLVGGRIRGMVPTGQHELEGRVQMVSGKGKVLLPGFVDMHVLFGEGDPRLELERMLAEGVTTAVVVGHEQNVEALQRAIASGAFPGPRLFRSTRPIQGMAPLDAPYRLHEVQQVDGPRAAARAARTDLERHRSDFVRLDWTPDVSPEVARALVLEADAYKKPVFAIAPDAAGAVAAAEAGVALLLAPPWTDPLDGEDVHALAIAGVPVVTAQGLCMEGASQCAHTLGANLGALRRGGIPLLVGTGRPGRSVVDEIEALVAAGMRPADAIQAANRLPVRLLDPAAKFGVIASGGYADLVMVDGNPLEDVGALRRVVAVWQAGHLLRPATSN